jgi:hypothetical protein
MSRYICKIVTNIGACYAVYESVDDQFVTRPSSLRLCARYLSYSPDKARTEAERNVFDLRSNILNHISECISLLESGKTLTDEDAVIVSRFYDFLQATVAPQQYKYEEAEELVVNSWIKELKLMDQFPECEDWWEMVSDHGIYSAFQNAAHVQKFPVLERYPPPTEQQNILAGRYLRALAKIANILGDQRSAITEVMIRFYQKLMTEKKEN